MKSFLYIIRRFKTAHALNLLGLTVAFAAFYVFMTQVQYARRYNRSLYEYENLYRMESSGAFSNGVWIANLPRPIAEGLRKMPQVDGTILFNFMGTESLYKDGTKMYHLWYKTNPGSLECLNPKLVDGTLKIENERQMVIPASLAETYFGTKFAAGKQMWVDEKEYGEVVGVYEDYPKNCDIRNPVFTDMGNENEREISNWNYTIYVRLHPEADREVVAQAAKKTYFDSMNGLFEEMKEQLSEEEQAQAEKELANLRLQFRLTPVTETYMSGVDASFDLGNPGVLLVLSLASLLVIIVAGINFANFSLAQTPSRIRGINTRKVLGASNFLIRHQLVAEGVIIALVACALSVLLCHVLSLMPSVQQMVKGSLNLSEHLNLLVLMLNTAVMLGILATLYPAFYATSFPPALVLKGSFGLSPRGKALRQVLVGVQLTIATVMVGYIGILFLQSSYVFNSDFGFDKDEIMLVNLPERPDGEKRSAMYQELTKLAGVENATFSNGTVGLDDAGMSWGRGNERHVSMRVFTVDWHFLPTYGIKVIEGRDFNEHDGDVYIVNEAMKKSYEWIEMDKPLSDNDDDLTVIGVCENIRFGSVRLDRNTAHVAFVIYGEQYKNWENPFYTLSVRCAAHTDKISLKHQIEEIVDRLLNEPGHEARFMDEALESTYREEFLFINQVKVFSAICFIITLIGVFCLTMFETEYRRKEIGIRRVMGASISQILALFSRRYIGVIAASFVIGAPLSYYMGSQWLQNFAEHTPIYWWLFPLALLVVSLVTLATVNIQSWRVAHENPINSIKTE